MGWTKTRVEAKDSIKLRQQNRLRAGRSFRRMEAACAPPSLTLGPEPRIILHRFAKILAVSLNWDRNRDQ